MKIDKRYLKELKRIRYTTSHPKDVTKDLIEAHRDCEKLMPILHLPVQSGSSKVLKAMNRKHNIEEYSEIICKLKTAKPNIKFSSEKLSLTHLTKHSFIFCSATKLNIRV